MAQDSVIFAALETAAKRRYKGFRIRYKNESFLMRVLARILWIVRFDRVTTTWGATVWFPCRSWVEGGVVSGGYRAAWKTLAHELVHVSDRERFGVAFPLMYAFPQVLVLLALPAVFAIDGDPHWLWWLAFLVFAAPIPSPTRAWLELRGYSMSMAVNYWRYGAVVQETRNWVLLALTSPLYYWMLPVRRWAATWLARYESRLKRGVLFEGRAGEPFRLVSDVLNSVRDR